MVCPGYMPSGKQTGAYQTRVNESYQGISQITAEDVAHFMVSQIDNPAYYSQRIAIGY
jgi:putative NADH-flavin reductase